MKYRMKRAKGDETLLRTQGQERLRGERREEAKRLTRAIPGKQRFLRWIANKIMKGDMIFYEYQE